VINDATRQPNKTITCVWSAELRSNRPAGHRTCTGIPCGRDSAVQASAPCCAWMTRSYARSRAERISADRSHSSWDSWQSASSETYKDMFNYWSLNKLLLPTLTDRQINDVFDSIVLQLHLGLPVVFAIGRVLSRKRMHKHSVPLAVRPELAVVIIVKSPEWQSCDLWPWTWAQSGQKCSCRPLC